MTVYSGVLTRHQAVSVKIERASVLRLNLFLILIAAIVVITYVFMSNFLVYQKYTLSTHKAEFNQLNAKLPVGKQYGADSDLGGLTLFAKKFGLVEAKDTNSILENDGFAVLP